MRELSGMLAPRGETSTRLALTPPLVSVRVVRCQRVPPFAALFAGVGCREAGTGGDVDQVRDQPKMPGVDASPVGAAHSARAGHGVARMVDCPRVSVGVGRAWPVAKLPREHVRTHHAAVPVGVQAVSPVGRCGPQPAFVRPALVDFQPEPRHPVGVESGRSFRGQRVSVLTPLGVVAGAEFPGVHGAVTVRAFRHGDIVARNFLARVV